jgi:hypothetical protein
MRFLVVYQFRAGPIPGGCDLSVSLLATTSVCKSGTTVRDIVTKRLVFVNSLAGRIGLGTSFMYPEYVKDTLRYMDQFGY